MVLHWTIDDVCHWVELFGHEYSNYAHSFRQDHTDGFRLCNFINDKVLIEFGVHNPKHRQTLLDGANQLRQTIFYNKSRY